MPRPAALDPTVREGEEDAPEAPKRRKGKGAKRGRKPCCAACAEGSGPCEGTKKDSLTAQEYLTACSLGINHKSTMYIKSRLDAATVPGGAGGTKCGGGYIAKGKKCNKGAGAAAPASGGKGGGGLLKKVAVGAALAGGAALLANKGNRQALRTKGAGLATAAQVVGGALANKAKEGASKVGNAARTKGAGVATVAQVAASKAGKAAKNIRSSASNALKKGGGEAESIANRAGQLSSKSLDKIRAELGNRKEAKAKGKFKDMFTKEIARRKRKDSMFAAGFPVTDGENYMDY